MDSPAVVTNVTRECVAGRDPEMYSGTAVGTVVHRACRGQFPVGEFYLPRHGHGRVQCALQCDAVQYNEEQTGLG